MNLYIHQENQQMLWDIMNKISMVNHFFKAYPPEQKERWFKSVIQMFYEKYAGKNITYNELQQINQETISYILNSIQEKTHPARPIAEPTPSFAYQPPALAQPIPPRQDSKEAFLNKQFEVRQKEYTSMFDKPPPEQPNFTEKLEDTAISNMEELIQQQRRLRALDIQQYAPPPPIKIENQMTPENIQSEIIELPPPKKNVTWSEEEPSTSKFTEELVSLKSMLSDLSNVISVLTRDVSYIKQHIDMSALNQHE